MLRRIAGVLALSAGLAGVLAPGASAQSVTVCVEAHVTVAGNAVVDQDQTCTTLPPEG